MPTITKQQLFEEAKKRGVKPSQIMEHLAGKGYTLDEGVQPKKEFKFGGEASGITPSFSVGYQKPLETPKTTEQYMTPGAPATPPIS